MAHSQACFMGPLQASNTIGQELKALCNTGPTGVFEQAHYPEPDFYTTTPGRPSAFFRFDGIVKDDWGYYRELPKPYTSPSDLRYVLRIYHVKYPPAEEAVEDLDAYVYAQQKVMAGFDTFYVAMRQDPTLGGLVMDTILTGAIAGDLRDPRTTEEFYGMEVVLITSLY